MLELTSIQDVHAELTTLCNARCPLCVRNAGGYPHNFGYPETSLSLSDIKNIFPDSFLIQLKTFTVCGNYGDFVVNPDSLEILQHIKQINPNIRITVSTNGSARNQDFWVGLGKLGIEISFCIDGLEDTHSIYRIDTNWQHIIRNAKYFISAGGRAIWKMIKFDHNLHQIEQARAMAAELGFMRFDLADHGRASGAAFDRTGNLTHTIGDGPHHNTPESMIQWYKKPIEEDYMLNLPEKNSIDCYSKKEKSIYLAANGEIYPCCFLGFFPKTFANSHWFDQGNRQLQNLLENRSNNALEVGLEKAIEWFSDIESSWSKDRYQQGRLRFCDEHCGTEKYIHDRQDLSVI